MDYRCSIFPHDSSGRPNQSSRTTKLFNNASLLLNHVLNWIIWDRISKFEIKTQPDCVFFGIRTDFILIIDNFFSTQFFLFWKALNFDWISSFEKFFFLPTMAFRWLLVWQRKKGIQQKVYFSSRVHLQYWSASLI